MIGYDDYMKKTFGIIIGLVLVGAVYFLFVSTKNNDVPEADQQEQQETDFVSVDINEEAETLCYQYSSEEEDFSELAQIKITFSGSDVSGTKRGSSQSGEYSLGYEGGFVGSLAPDGTVNVINTTSIGGGGGITAEERYLFRDGDLTEYRYAYKEDFQKNILRIDESVPDNGLGKDFPVVTKYTRVDCESII